MQKSSQPVTEYRFSEIRISRNLLRPVNPKLVEGPAANFDFSFSSLESCVVDATHVQKFIDSKKEVTDAQTFTMTEAILSLLG